jgi:hypothetical protein
LLHGITAEPLPEIQPGTGQIPAPRVNRLNGRTGMVYCTGKWTARSVYRDSDVPLHNCPLSYRFLFAANSPSCFQDIQEESRGNSCRFHIGSSTLDLDQFTATVKLI